MLRPGREPEFVSNCGREIRFARRHCANTRVIIGARSETDRIRGFHKRARARDTRRRRRRRPVGRYAGRIAPGCPGYTDDRLLQKLDSRSDGKRNIWDSSAGHAWEQVSKFFFFAVLARIPRRGVPSTRLFLEFYPRQICTTLCNACVSASFRKWVGNRLRNSVILFSYRRKITWKSSPITLYDLEAFYS